MGGSVSQVSNNVAVPGGNSHSPLPVDVVPYPGPALEYRVILIKSQLKQSLFGTRSSDINSYMDTLKQQYAEYFKLESFYQVPYTAERSGFTSALMSYQAIHSRPAVYVTSPEIWQLHVEPSKLEMSGNFGFSCKPMDSNMQDIYNHLAVKSQIGGRLICLECTGSGNIAGFNKAAFGVNLFFNIPSHPNPVLYTNIAHSNIMNISYSFKAVDIQCDFLGTMATHLDQGWKLIDILIPQHEVSMGMQDQKHRVYQMNVVWFFEKELQRFHANDMTPLYQVTMVEVESKISRGFTSISSQLEMGPILQEMGRSGWSLVCLLDTPKMYASGMTNVVNCSIAFFQRPILSASLPPPPQASYAPPPPYKD